MSYLVKDVQVGHIAGIPRVGLTHGAVVCDDLHTARHLDGGVVKLSSMKLSGQRAS